MKNNSTALLFLLMLLATGLAQAFELQVTPDNFLTPMAKEVVKRNDGHVRLLFTDGEILEAKIDIKAARAFLATKIGDMEFIEKTDFQPVTRGPQIWPVACNLQTGSNCSNDFACSCPPLSECRPGTSGADNKGCIEKAPPANAEKIGKRYACTNGLKWNSTLTACIAQSTRENKTSGMQNCHAAKENYAKALRIWHSSGKKDPQRRNMLMAKKLYQGCLTEQKRGSSLANDTTSTSKLKPSRPTQTDNNQRHRVQPPVSTTCHRAKEQYAMTLRAWHKSGRKETHRRNMLLAKKRYSECLNQTSTGQPASTTKQPPAQSRPGGPAAHIDGLWKTYGLKGKDWDLKAHIFQEGNRVRIKAETYFQGRWRPWKASGEIKGRTLVFQYQVEPGNSYGWVNGSAEFQLSEDGKMLSGSMKADNASWSIPVILFRN